MRWNVAWAGVLGLVAAAPEPSKDEIIESLQAEVAELKDTVSELKARQDSDARLTEERAEEIRGLVYDVLADADLRASMLQDGLTAGWDRNFFLASADGNWLLKISGQLDFRWVGSTQDMSPDGEDAEYGFEVRRAKIKFAGHVVDPTWEYEVLFAADHDDSGAQGDLDLENALVRKDFGNGHALQVGQYKLPFLFEETTSSTKQLAVERSLLNEFFNQDRSTALSWICSGDRLMVQLAYSDGFASKNKEALFMPDDQGDLEASNAFTARVDWLVGGAWKQFEDFTSPRGSEAGLKLGGAVHYERDKYNTFVMAPAGFKTEFTTWTVDGAYEGDGWNVFAYAVGRHTDSDDPAVASLDQVGFLVQGGWYVTDHWELFGRYEWADADVTGADDLSVVTLGANYYINGHALKWTTDVGIGLDGVAADFAAPEGTGWREDAAGQDGQVVLRSQFQLLF